ncbi:glycosyltransferase [Ancylobacter pratisalsi]|uniref:Glycosyltransferase n=1 Tax=Ancylobacter pratisalsi TaxID=1745854 RepID=A0A6P1YMV3_9HYPH|nr:glycosyltransferase [Ancylobacter pratisalsi]QIB34270.1 glycosyltransferase [Ancylobacter pratisalsi]
MTLKIEIWHNLLWSPYKAKIFNALDDLARAQGDSVHIFQIALTDGSRKKLGTIDRSEHRYNYELLFDESYEETGRLRRLWACVKRVVRTRADVIVLAGYDQPEYWAQQFILRLRGKTVGLFCDSTLLDNPYSRLKSTIKTLIFSNVQGVFCYGQRSRELALHHGAPPEGVFVDCQAARLPDDYRRDEVIPRRAALRAPVETPRFLFVGRIAVEKRIDDLLQAFAGLVEVHPSAELVIVGSGAEEARLRQLAQQLGVAERTQFTGPQSGEALWDQYRRATCLALPSSSEPWGLVVNEALAFGCPVVASNRCGCVPELIREGETGFVFACGDIAALRDRMEQAVHQFADARATGDACLETVGRFTPGNAAQQIYRGVRALAGEKAGTSLS